MMLIVSSLFVVVFLLILLQGALHYESKEEDSELEPLEAGFEGLSLGYTLSSPFLFLAILFVLFDLEILLLFPMVMFLPLMSSESMMSWLALMVFVLLSLLLEWTWCGLKWVF